MRTLLLFLSFITLSPAGSTQEVKPVISIPMKNGIVFYEKTFRLDKPVSKSRLPVRIEQWFKTSFPQSKEKIEINAASNLFTSKGLLKIITDSAAGHYYQIKSTITIFTKDDSCTFQSYNYYEKPVMPGVTNDYSKIEYRWWDFRQGKPWNKEDEALFTGLNNQTLSMLNSFEAALNN